jgi:protein-L-isoaspartate O-methyltransferase
VARRTLWLVASGASYPLVAAARAAGVRDLRVLEAPAAVPRARYGRPSDAGVADRDIPIPIGGEQVTTQPSLPAVMVAALALRGSEGLAAHAPYEAIVVAAAHPFVPPPPAAQVTPGGRLVQPIGPSGLEDVTLFRGGAGGRLIRMRVIARARFVALYGRHGFAQRNRETAAGGD